jgi:hypothetical protein
LQGALILHLRIDLAINLPVFEWAFIFALVTFIKPEDLRKILNRIQEKLHALKTTQTANQNQ